jgi:succinate dehydrogenase/fumarate reductase flavoprotein subunit
MVREWRGSIAGEHDVVVVGSGAIGLTAALVASRAGARVAVLEKAEFFGGSAALSGGMLWVPLNHLMDSDDRDGALRYLRAVTAGRTDEAVLAALVDRGTDMLRFLEDEAGVRFVAMEQFPDYHPEWDGAHPGGRSLDPVLYDASALGDLAGALRPDHRLPFTMVEYETWRAFTSFPWDELREREVAGQVARGRALVAPAGGTRVAAPAGVVVASGGFEWSAEMKAAFLPGPLDATCSPPTNTGDGIRMASKAGAALGNMQEAWWFPMLLVGDEMDGRPTGTLPRFERTGPYTIIVNRAGRRFVNEAHNYNDMTKAFHTFDPRAYTFANLPAFLVFDARHLAEYGFLTHRVGEPTPGWLAEGATLEALAERIGVDADGLRTTVERFNEHARAGHDPDFHRGESAYDRYWGDPHAEHPALGPLEVAPYYAVEIVSGAIGTKGGIVTDADGRALDAFGEPVPGLYAAGNTTAHPMGPGYPGAGATLGPGCTMAFLAGRAVAGARVA